MGSLKIHLESLNISLLVIGMEHHHSVLQSERTIPPLLRDLFEVTKFIQDQQLDRSEPRSFCAAPDRA